MYCALQRGYQAALLLATATMDSSSMLYGTTSGTSISHSREHRNLTLYELPFSHHFFESPQLQCSTSFSDRLTSHVLSKSRQTREDPSIREEKSVLIRFRRFESAQPLGAAISQTSLLGKVKSGTSHRCRTPADFSRSLRKADQGSTRRTS